MYYLHDLQLDFLVEQNRTQLEVSQGAMQQFSCALLQMLLLPLPYKTFSRTCAEYLISISGSHFRACTQRLCISTSSTTEMDLQPQEMRSVCIGSDFWPITWRKPTFPRWHTLGFGELRFKHLHSSKCVFLFAWLPIAVKELYSLMFSLDWVNIKAQIMGPAHLISDYVEYGHILDKEVSIKDSPCVLFLLRASNKNHIHCLSLLTKCLDVHKKHNVNFFYSYKNVNLKWIILKWIYTAHSFFFFLYVSLVFCFRTVTCAVSSRSSCLWTATSWSSAHFLTLCNSPCHSRTPQTSTDRHCSRRRNGPEGENCTLTGCKSVFYYLMFS